MILLDKPYVSDLLTETIAFHQFPLIKNQEFNWLNLPSDIHIIDPEQAVIELNAKEYPLLYSNSENAIEWIATNLKHTHLPENIELFKNKARFRSLISDLYPNFFYKEVSFDALDTIDPEELPMPFIIKPNVGFFSLSVHKVTHAKAWEQVKEAIKSSIQHSQLLYPPKVVNTQNFIIEQVIEGEEYAIDAYFNNHGEPVIVGIFKHLFSSDTDVSDRVYYTSKVLIEEMHQPFKQFLDEVGTRAKLKNFPIHVEVRVGEHGLVNPIEVNPMRFGGWCTTADLTTMAFGLNPYVYYCHQQKPDWEKLLADKGGKKFCMVLLDNSSGYASNQIASFNYQKLKESFEKPIELRPTEWNQFPLFGILFTETRDENFQEIEKILTSDLREFITLLK